MSAQIKILYGHEYERCKTATTSIVKFKSLTSEGLESLVFSNVGSFYRDSSNLRIQYRDDEFLVVKELFSCHTCLLRHLYPD